MALFQRPRMRSGSLCTQSPGLMQDSVPRSHQHPHPGLVQPVFKQEYSPPKSTYFEQDSSMMAGDARLYAGRQSESFPGLDLTKNRSESPMDMSCGKNTLSSSQPPLSLSREDFHGRQKIGNMSSMQSMLSEREKSLVGSVHSWTENNNSVYKRPELLQTKLSPLKEEVVDEEFDRKEDVRGLGTLGEYRRGHDGVEEDTDDDSQHLGRLSKHDLKLLTGSQSSLYNFPSQVPMMSSTFSLSKHYPK